MASSSFYLFGLFCLFSSATAVATAVELPEEKTTHLQFYFHVILQGANTTTFTVAGLHRNSSSFGNVLVYDCPVTEGPELSSKLIGRWQGMDVMASLEDGSVLTMQNCVFTDGQYNGSTVALFGRADVSASTERTIVGGSGVFRLAQGYALTTIVQSSPSYYLLEFDFYIMHY